MAMFVLGRVFAPADPDASFSGKTVIVTGANSGLGYEAAAKFLKKDAQKVVLAVRTVSKGETAKKSIVEQYGHEERLEVWELDMSNYDSIKRFADKANTLERLDVALLNAGVFMTEYEASSYSWEHDLQVNTISTTLLAILLLPKLKKSRTAEITPVLEFTNSGTHLRVDTTTVATADSVLKAVNDQTFFVPSLQYGTSKLLLMFVSQVLAELVASSTTLIDSVCPGACRSDLSRSYDSFLMRNVVKPVVFPVFRTAEQGARTLVSGTTLGPEAHGRFWQHDKIKPRIDLLNNKSLQEKIWKEIIDAIRKDVPEIDNALDQVRSS